MSDIQDAWKSLQWFARMTAGVAALEPKIGELVGVEALGDELRAKVTAAQRELTAWQAEIADATAWLAALQGENAAARADGDAASKAAADQAAKIVSDAQARAVAIVDEARTKGAGIVSDARDKADEIVGEAQANAAEIDKIVAFRTAELSGILADIDTKQAALDQLKAALADLRTRVGV